MSPRSSTSRLRIQNQQSGLSSDRLDDSSVAEAGDRSPKRA
ncbi:MAG: hypothetical protein AAF596_03615 [Planctomycetota bacterium]